VGLEPAFDGGGRFDIGTGEKTQALRVQGMIKGAVVDEDRSKVAACMMSE
jgi:hypothetical protein